MTYAGPFCYTLQLSGSKDTRFISSKICDGKAGNFNTAITKDKTPKIYVLTYEKEVVYVGYASQSIGKRLGQGVRAHGVNGYHGYKWKQVDRLELTVFVFDKELKGNKQYDIPFIEFAEAVEAEIVYLVRQSTGKWPKYQNEIHFNNSANTLEREKVKAIAKQMYEKVQS